MTGIEIFSVAMALIKVAQNGLELAKEFQNAQVPDDRVPDILVSQKTMIVNAANKSWDVEIARKAAEKAEADTDPE